MGWDIPNLNTAPIDTATPIDSAQNAEMNGLKIVKQRYDNATDAQKKQVRDVAVISQQLLGMSDPQMQAAFIDKNKGLIGEHATEMTQALATDPAAAKQMFGSQVKLAQLLGAMETPSALNVGGGTGALMDRLMAENPGLSADQALQKIKAGYSQNTTMDAGGNITPMAGALETKGAFKQSEAIGDTTGQGIGKSKMALGSIEDNASVVLGNVQELMTHPGKEKALGLIDSNTPTVKGTDADAFEQRLAQVNGAAFLTAFEALRGGGAITEIEGDKATVAKNRMSTAHTVKEFDDASQEFVAQVSKGIRLARQQAAGNLRNPTPPPITGGEGTSVPEGTQQSMPTVKQWNEYFQ